MKSAIFVALAVVTFGMELPTKTVAQSEPTKRLIGSDFERDVLAEQHEAKRAQQQDQAWLGGPNPIHAISKSAPETPEPPTPPFDRHLDEDLGIIPDGEPEKTKPHPRAEDDEPQFPIERFTPVSVKISGPITSVIGDKVYLTPDIGGDSASILWTVLPAGTVGLDQHDLGRRADFSTRFPGQYTFFVSVSGRDGSVAHAFYTVEMQPGEMPVKASVKSAKSTMPDVPALIAEWTSEVRSPTRDADRLRVASALRKLAGGLDTGTIRTTNPVGEAVGMCNVALAGSGPAWAEWMDHFGELFREFERLRVLPTLSNYAAAFRNVAAVLEK